MNILHWIFPPHCVRCRTLSNWLCASCREDFFLSLDKRISSVDLPLLDKVFITCHDRSHTLSRLLYAWKYKRYFEVGQILQNIFTEAVISIYGTSEALLWVPIPIHTKRLRERGFNQTHDLVWPLANKFNFLVLDLIHRAKNTRTQVGLTKKERQENVKDAFVINHQLMKDTLLQNRIILVDDILTSGTTLQECAQVLQKAGFKHIDAFVLHRGTK